MLSNEAHVHAAEILAVRGASGRPGTDQLAVEAPLELAAKASGEAPRPLVVTMRTPGDDDELALGFLWSEGVLRSPDDVRAVERAGEDSVVVELTAEAWGRADGAFAAASRGTLATSACGVCGKTDRAALDSLPTTRATGGGSIAPAVINGLGATLRAAQRTFAVTGGLHAAAFFDHEGGLRLVREDVGRHNAVDKLVGALLRTRALPVGEGILLVSGRASFELVQKALAAGVPVLAAVGAPSSAAVELASGRGLTLLGFVRDDRFNVYAGAERIRMTEGTP